MPPMHSTHTSERVPNTNRVDAERAADNWVNGNRSTTRQIIQWSVEPVACALVVCTLIGEDLQVSIDKLLDLFNYDGPRA